jgi:hypothetical protein
MTKLMLKSSISFEDVLYNRYKKLSPIIYEKSFKKRALESDDDLKELLLDE